MTVVEPTGIRFFGVEIRERQIVATARATKESIYAMNWDSRRADDEFEKLSKAFLRLVQLMIENEEHITSSDAETLQKLFKLSGLVEYEGFFGGILKGISKRKLVVQMLSDFASVSVEQGSLLITFRNVRKRTEKLRVNLRKIWEETKKKSESLKNSFRQFARWATTGAKRTALHVGIYAVALAIVLLSVWYSFAFNVATNLGSLASNIVNSLKVAFPAPVLAIFIFCTLFGIFTSKDIVEKGIEAIKQFLA